MLVKFKTGPETDKEIEALKEYFGMRTAAGVVLQATEQYMGVVQELERVKSRLGAVEDAHGKLKQAIRDRNALDAHIRTVSEQGEMEL
jgi:adenine-specific DNA glycosylase